MKTPRTPTSTRRPLLVIGAALAAVFGAVVLVALTRDPSPLARLGGGFVVERDAAQARRLAARSKSLGRTDEVIVIPGGDHGRDMLPSDPGQRARVREFLDRRLRPGG